MGQWKQREGKYMALSLLICYILIETKLCIALESNNNTPDHKISIIDRELIEYVDELFTLDNYRIMPGLDIKIKNKSSSSYSTCFTNHTCDESRGFQEVEDYFYKKLDQYAENYLVNVNVSEASRFFKLETGKSSFMAGFGLGFLAFALKKLLLPFFIGAQIVKSILIAMFLPSILGSLGKLLGKGLSTFSGVSGSSAGHGAGAQTIEDFEFKDTSPYNNDVDADYSVNDNTLTMNTGTSSESPGEMNRFGENQRISYVPSISDSYYMRKPQKNTDYKIFHKIPPSSLLLTSYDPFYSPLLSRLDSVFQQLGLGESKSQDSEKCRERLVCMMYANPAKYAPYSNLISAQLSRELNELKKPTSDNQEILRFFRYMKAAKDGQDGEECLEHRGCPQLSTQQASPAMLTTYNDINKLVHARKLNS